MITKYRIDKGCAYEDCALPPEVSFFTFSKMTGECDSVVFLCDAHPIVYSKILDMKYGQSEEVVSNATHSSG